MSQGRAGTGRRMMCTVARSNGGWQAHCWNAYGDGYCTTRFPTRAEAEAAGDAYLEAHRRYVEAWLHFVTLPVVGKRRRQ